MVSDSSLVGVLEQPLHLHSQKFKPSRGCREVCPGASCLVVLDISLISFVLDHLPRQKSSLYST